MGQRRWDRIGRRLLPLTVFATFWLLLLGIYTAAIGAGLTCDGRWPLCDGAVFGLFPANWTSFVEWFHRLVAMITGFMLLGSWWVVWRDGRSRKAKWSLTVVILLLPVQVWLGAETVFQYEIIYLTAHFLTALIIFGALITGVWSWFGRGLSLRERRRLLGGVLALSIPFLLLTPHFLFVHSGRVQITYYGIGLTMLAALLVLGLDGHSERKSRKSWTTIVAWSGTIVLVVQLLAGRLVRSPTIHTIDWIAGALLVLLLVVGLWTTHQLDGVRGSSAPQ